MTSLAVPLPQPYRRWRIAVAAVLAAPLGVAMVMAHTLLVPPLGPRTHPVRTAHALLPADENAWSEYQLALADLAREPVPDWLVDVFEAPGLDTAQTAYLARHPAAVLHLARGAARARSQIFQAPPEFDTPVANFARLRTLSQLAAAVSKQLRLAGAPETALDLDLAVYRFGTDLVEPGSGWLMPVMAAGCRRTAATSLFETLRVPGLSAEACRRAARLVARENARMPATADVASWEWAFLDRSVEAAFVGGGDEPLRLRAFEIFVRSHAAVLEQARGMLERQDFRGLLAFDRDVLGALRAPAGWQNPWPTQALATQMLARTLPALSPQAFLLYADHATGAALTALYAARAFELANGRPPRDLVEAMGELPVPLDSASARAIGYRVDAGQSVVWLPGFDGRDDGGRNAYAVPQFASLGDGTDLVYRQGTRPAVLGPDPHRELRGRTAGGRDQTRLVN